MESLQRQFSIYAEKDINTHEFLKLLFKANADGLLTDNEAEKVLKRYFINHTKEMNYKQSLVDLRINKILSYPHFDFTKEYLYAINGYLFKGIFSSAGTTRAYNIVRKEPILDEESVIYAKSHLIEDCLDFDFQTFLNSDANDDNFLANLCNFINHIWQAHPFSDGNTRTIMIFLEKYLNSINIHVNNDDFKKNAAYIRNALVKGCFATNLDIEPDNAYLLSFLNKIIVNPEADLIPIQKITHSKTRKK